ncbi:MAG: aspartate aminotransferase family protein [Gammaproteobacteria bacterium]|nr:aspartate aminotransferase family protein [Gammaproteobacteria bacterium]
MSPMSDAAINTSHWQAIDRAHHLHPFSDTKALAQEGCRVITRADDIYIWDSDGNRLLDGMAGLWCVNIGYGRKELADAAHRQLLELPYYNNFFKTSAPSAIELAGLLAQVTAPHLNHVFFTNSGSEANDTMFRLVRRYWDLAGKPDKEVFISREHAYHGSTIAAASLGGMKPMHEQGHLPIPGIRHIAPPYWYRDGGDMSPEEFGTACARRLEEEINALGAGRVAAFIGEPIQSAGGLIVPPETYWPEIQRICSEHDVLLVVDEVICGFGRLGTWFGSDYYNLQPDLMPIAKGLSSGYLPIGGVMVADRVADLFIAEGEQFAHGFTYSGHPAACAVAIANIGIMRDENIVENVRDNTGPYLEQRWNELAQHPLVGETRGVGFLRGLELVKNKREREFFDPVGSAGQICRDICFDNGLVMRAIRDTMAISPPLTMTREQVDELIELVCNCLDLTAKAL